MKRWPKLKNPTQLSMISKCPARCAGREYYNNIVQSEIGK